MKVLSALVYDLGSRDGSRVDPVIRVRGELPGSSLPFVVRRVYQGAQGRYDEGFAILAPDGEVVYEHSYARILLRGEMFEDAYEDTVTRPTTFSSAGEHTLVLLVGDAPVGRFPVHVDAPESLRAAGMLSEAITKALQRSDIIWLTIPQPAGGTVVRPAWFVYEDGKVFVLTGPEEQDLPNLGSAREVTITTRTSDGFAQVGEVPAAVRVVDPQSEEFERIGRQGVVARLNLRDGEAAFDRWRETCQLAELTPVLEPAARTAR